MDQFDFGQEARRVRVGTFIRLRWIAIAGQIAALLVARLALDLDFPFAASSACVAALIALNLWLRTKYPQAKRLDDTTTTYILAGDIGQLGAMLYLTGGLANPFAMLLLAPTMISAVSQTRAETAKLLAFAILCACVLAIWRTPLQRHGVTYLDPPPIEIVSFLVAIVISAIFIALYGSQVAREARQLATALSATELLLARAQHLSQLDGLAAAAAHELGTPLATLTVVVHELSNQREVTALAGDDLALARQELARCRSILGQLSNANRLAAEPFDRVEIDALIEEAAGPHRLQGIDIAVTLEGADPRPTCARNPAVVHGIRNLVENAISFARAQVRIEAKWGREKVEITVVDDGPGFPAAVINRLGEPYISDRAGGLGLGLFIAKALLERAGAELRIANLAAPQHGAVAVVSWPRRRFGPEARPALARADHAPA